MFTGGSYAPFDALETIFFFTKSHIRASHGGTKDSALGASFKTTSSLRKSYIPFGKRSRLFGGQPA
jgi:hypothetical protein